MILIVGCKGMLGRDLLDLAGERATGIDIEELDITSLEDCFRVLNELRPSVVINCAAYTNVDGCESNAETAMQVNGEGVAHLAMATRDIGALLVHVSTDYIFDGSKGAPYTEDDLPRPLNVYGESKLAGEMNADFNPDHLIVRTQWLYGLHGNNFVETMLKFGAERPTLTVVDDQTGSPTWTRDLARAILALVERECRGVYHVANSGFCTWNDFARAIFEDAGMSVSVLPQTTAELNRPAQRPLYSTLDCAKLQRDTGVSLPPWRESLKQYLSLRSTVN